MTYSSRLRKHRRSPKRRSVYDTARPFKKPGGRSFSQTLMSDLRWRIKVLTGWGIERQQLHWRMWDLPFSKRVGRNAVRIYDYVR